MVLCVQHYAMQLSGKQEFTQSVPHHERSFNNHDDVQRITNTKQT